ncbi:hypothetical protein ENSA5_45530 [Enhygromyxa salina]|uniref:Uncharacterized protein n=1 Tax=Enhygromyxa salina TaxID=215803 RepID=A0A2S9XK57_9BACT|nr:hypothetical protein [Enhygromyxa salina]PRP93061.1 hypothetical protein ENSA5_45530 [Enhygromyxa salina]
MRTLDVMYPCSSCHRHLREADDACPFCGVVQRKVAPPVGLTLSTFALAAATMLGVSACSTETTGDDGNTTTSAGSSETTEATGESDSSSSDTSTTGDGDGDMTNDDSNTSGSFYACSPVNDWWDGVFECDPFAQDCPEGEKCVPYASTGESYDANKCVPITGSQETGEACTYGGIVEATDDCDQGSHCFHVEGTEGVCTAFCTGTADDPVCDPGTECLISNEGSINLCLTSCHPVTQDCADGYACDWFEGAFMCWLEGGAAAVGEECTSFDSCAAGSSCVASEAAPGCEGASCCTEYCDLSDPLYLCTIPGTDCTSVYEEGEAPEGLENVGLCLVPPP